MLHFFTFLMSFIVYIRCYKILNHSTVAIVKQKETGTKENMKRHSGTVIPINLKWKQNMHYLGGCITTHKGIFCSEECWKRAITVV